jgi:hypothetical protein
LAPPATNKIIIPAFRQSSLSIRIVNVIISYLTQSAYKLIGTCSDVHLPRCDWQRIDRAMLDTFQARNAQFSSAVSCLFLFVPGTIAVIPTK